LCRPYGLVCLSSLTQTFRSSVNSFHLTALSVHGCFILATPSVVFDPVADFNA
jgi:hypothetical protein